MLKLKRTGSGAALAKEISQVVDHDLRTAAAKALTFTAQKAQQRIVSELGRVFEGGATQFTLNSTRIEPASADKLQARVAVKDKPASGGNRPESALFPQVFGGPRAEKGMERALRYSGILQEGERVSLGRSAPRDQFGNLLRKEIAAILRFAEVPARTGRKATKGAAKKARRSPYFRGQLHRSPGLSAIFFADAGEVFPVLIIKKQNPVYKARLDFAGIAEDVARQEFAPTLRRLLKSR